PKCKKILLIVRKYSWDRKRSELLIAPQRCIKEGLCVFPIISVTRKASIFNKIMVKFTTEFAFQKIENFCLIEEKIEIFALVVIVEFACGLQSCSIIERKLRNSEG